MKIAFDEAQECDIPKMPEDVYEQILWGVRFGYTLSKILGLPVVDGWIKDYLDVHKRSDPFEDAHEREFLVAHMYRCIGVPDEEQTFRR